MRLIIIALALCCFGLNSFAQNTEEEINQINHLQKDLNFDYLNEIWLKSADVNNNDAQGYAKRASEKMGKGYYNEAFNDIEKSISIDPDFDFPYLLKGIYYMSIDSVKLAREAFNSAIKLNSLNPIFFYYLGNLNLQESNLNEAKNSFDHSIEIDNKFFLGYFGLGNTYRIQGNVDKAKRCYKKVLAINSKFPDAYFSLGLLEIFKRDRNSALKYFNEAISSNAQFSPAYYILGRIYFYEKDFEEALKQFDKAVEFDNENVHYLFWKGQTNIFCKNFDKAYSDIIKAIKLKKLNRKLFAGFGDPSFNEKSQNIITQFVLFDENESLFKDPIKPMLKKYLCYLFMGNKINAWRTIEEVTSIENNNSIINFYKAYTYEYQGELSLAKKCYLGAASQSPTIYAPYFSLGVLNYRTEEFAESIENLSNFIANNDTAKMAYKYRGISYMETGEFEKAINDFTIYSKMDNSGIDIKLNKALCHKNLNDYENAIKEYDEILKIKDYGDELYSLRAECKYFYNDTIGALEELNKISSKYYKFNPKLHFLSGMIKSRLNLYDEAIKHYTLGLVDDPENVEIVSIRAGLCSNIGEFESALNDYTFLINKNNHDPVMYYMRGMVYMKMEQFDKACKDFKIAESIGFVIPVKDKDACN